MVKSISFIHHITTQSSSETKTFIRLKKIAIHGLQSIKKKTVDGSRDARWLHPPRVNYVASACSWVWRWRRPGSVPWSGPPPPDPVGESRPAGSQASPWESAKKKKKLKKGIAKRAHREQRSLWKSATYQLGCTLCGRPKSSIFLVPGESLSIIP